MRHLTLFFVLSLVTAIAGFAQTGSIQGLVIDSKTTAPIENLAVKVDATDIVVYTNTKGEFLLNNVPAGIGTLIFVGTDFESKELDYKLKSGELLKIGTVSMKTDKKVPEIESEILVIELEDSEVGDDEGASSSSQGVSGLLHSSNDLFSSTAAYTFGTARFRVRGYDQNNSGIFFNGIEMNNIENGRPVWSDWGGLNDAVRNKEISFGGDESSFSLNALGGTANIITRASEYRPGVKVSYMSTNRTYRNRVMATASTGLMENGLAVTLSGSHRWAQEGYIEGTFYDAWACLLAVEKQFNKRHSLALTAFVAPNKRGKLIGSNQDAYDYLDNNFYNANWGYQNGEKRNSRIANTFKPFATLTHYWDINEKLKINTSLAYSFGRTGATALNWYDAKDPRPNYYKYLPYYNREKENYVWENTQVNWDYFYFANAKNLYTLSNVNGVSGNNVTFNRSKYIVEDRRVDHNQLKATVFADYDLNEDLKLSGNVNYTWYKGRHFKLVDDLLGGDYWVDVDQFAERDFDDPVVAQSNLDNPNRLTKVGDTFGYDYDANIQQIGGFVKADYTMGALDLYLGTQLSSTSFFRTGNMRTGKFPTESFGDSKKQNFFNYGVSLGANYKITGRHIVYANAKYTTRAPYFKNAYVSPRTRDHAVNNLTSEKIMSADLNYVIRLPFLTGRVSGYYSKFEDQTKIKSYFNDLNHSFINYTMTGIDNKHFGVEAALEGKITSELSVLAVAAIGQYTYDSRPDLSVTVDNSGEPPSTPSSKNPFLNKPNDGVVYLKNFYLPGMPQRAYSLGVKYSSPKFWWIEANANYFDKIYLDFHPARRVESAIIGLDPSIPTDADKIKAITQQEQLSSNFTVNISGGKSWKIGDYFLRLHAQVNNLLDNKSFATGGYEQARFDYAKRDLNKFSPNYFYAYGRNYMLILTFQF